MDKYTLIGLTAALVILAGIGSSGLQDDSFVNSENGTNVTQNSNVSKDNGHNKTNGTVNGSTGEKNNSSYDYLNAFM